MNWLRWVRLDALTGTQANGWNTQPWRSAEADGVYISANKDVWLYRILPLKSIEFEDPQERLSAQTKLERLLIELGDTSRDLGQGMGMLAQRRPIHLLAVLHEEPSHISDDIAPELAAVQQQMMYHTNTDKLFAIGVKLRRDSLSALTNADNENTMKDKLKNVAASKNDTDLSAFTADYTRINGLCSRAGASVPTAEQRSWLESWFNNGQGVDTRIGATDTRLYIADGTTWQIGALWSVDEMDMKLSSPGSPWALDAMNHQAGADVISIRADLEPANVTRGRSRKSQRILRSQEEEELATGDVSRDEITEKAAMAKNVENYIRAAGSAWLSNTSVLFARRMEGPGEAAPDETYADMLYSWYGFGVKPLEKRQLPALAEMLPGSDTRINPFGQDVNCAWAAYSGIAGFGRIGDDSGLYMADASPHSTPVLLETEAAARLNKGPAMCIFGRPGSGKASAVSARIHTPTGWTTMGQLRIGDTITAPDGGTQTVTELHPQGPQPIYKVTFNDGSCTRVTSDHQWTVIDTATARAHTIATTELGEPDTQWALPPVQPARNRELNLPIDPYVYAVLLTCATATSNGALMLTGLNPHASGELSTRLPQGHTLVHGDRPGTHHIVTTTGGHNSHDLCATFTAMLADTRRVSEDYKHASDTQRGELLAGFRAVAAIDVAGHTQPAPLAVTYPAPFGRAHAHLPHTLLGLPTAQLAADVVEVARSLERLATTQPAGLTPSTRTVVALSDNRCQRTVTGVTIDGVEHAQCIKVSGPAHLYITDDYIATHNTFAAQLIAGQAALNGSAAILINPKGHDSLSAFADWIRDNGAPATVVSLSALTKEGGAFDPFRFAEPQAAAEILTRHILNAVGVTYEGGLNGAQEIELRRGLNEAAEAGARCAHDAMAFMRDRYITQLVADLAESSALFQLGYGYVPGVPWGARSGFTLIEFDRDMGWPAPGKNPASYDGPEREAVGALRLISRASIEILMRSGGGTLVVDEAHHFLASPEGRATIDRINREGRSLRLLPIFCTQRVTDLVGGDQRVDMETFLSRVLALNLPDKAEAAAALTLCGLEPTEERVAFLRQADSGVGFFRDIHDRHGIIRTGAGVSADMYLAMSTNSQDRDKRAETKLRLHTEQPGT